MTKRVSWKLVWQLLATVFLLTVPVAVLTEIPIWVRPLREIVPLAGLALAYLSAALILIAGGYFTEKLTWVWVMLVFASVFAVLFLMLLVTPRVQFSAHILMVTFVLAAFLIIQFFVLERFSGLTATVMVAAVLMAGGGTELIKIETHAPTAFYDLRLLEFRKVIPQAKNGGGISRLGKDYLVVTFDGRLHRVRFDARSKKLDSVELPYQVPLNRVDYATDAGDHEHWFRTADVLAEEADGRVRVFVSHHFWKREPGCFVARVSKLEGSRTAFDAGDPSLQWSTVHDASPCLKLKQGPPGHRFAGHQMGGGLALLDKDRLLLAVGDQEFDGVNADSDLPQDPAAEYGKILLIHLASGQSEVLTLGHRNPQGLVVGAQGSIWSTEHGPQGGDELNRIRRGSNYGWPLVTLGTQYGSTSWPLSQQPGEHHGYELPLFAWTPAIGVSSLIEVRGDLFPIWREDLLVASLKDSALWRTRVRDDRVVYAERIPVGRRIRDLVEGADGRLVLWTDQGDLIVIEPDEVTSFATCIGCHPMMEGVDSALGPNLRNVVGRPIAFDQAFQYSDALMRLEGRWTVDRLDQFLADPQGFAPGTLMQIEGVKEADVRSKLIEFLQTR